MKKTLIVGVFLAISGGVASVAALQGAAVEQSFVQAQCLDGLGLSYSPTELEVLSQQPVEPMSRFLRTIDPLLSFHPFEFMDACDSADPTKGEGIAFAAKALGVVTSREHLVCDPAYAAGSTSCIPSGPTGLKHSGTVAGYTLGANSSVTKIEGWRDVLRLIYLGLPHTAGLNPDPSTAQGKSLRDCNSAVRLIPLPTGPVCQDFPQENCGLNLTPSDACANNPAGIPRGH